MPTDKIKILILKTKGLSQAEIAKELKVHPNTVKRWIDRYEQTGGLDRKKGSGRKRLLKEGEVLKLEKKLKENGELSYKNLRDSMKLKASRRTLNDYGIKLGFSKHQYFYIFLFLCFYICIFF